MLEDKAKGYAYSEKGNSNNAIGVNTLYTDLPDSGDVINTIFHETTNLKDHTANKQTALNRGNTAEAIWDLKNFGNRNTNKISNYEWNKNNAENQVIISGTKNSYVNYQNARNNPNATIDNFLVTGAVAAGTYLLYKGLGSLAETGVEYGIANLTGDEEFNPLLSFGKNMAVNSTIGLIPGILEAKIGTKMAIYGGELVLRTAGDTAVEAITREGDVSRLFNKQCSW